MNKQPSSAALLRWLGDAQRARLVAHLSDACVSTLKKWRGAHNVFLSVTHLPDAGNIDSSVSIFRVSAGGEQCLTWSLESDALRQLLAIPAGNVAKPDAATSLLAHLEQALVNALSLAIVPRELSDTVTTVRASKERSPATAGTARKAQHAFGLSIDGQTPCCRLTLKSPLLDLLAPRGGVPGSAALVSRRSAISDQNVSLSANLGQVNVAFGDLQKMAVGDVLVLQAPLAAPIALLNESGQRIADGMLGRLDRNLAVRLSSLAVQASTPVAYSEKRSAR